MGGHPVGDERFKPHLFLPSINDVARNEVIVSTVQAVLGTENVLLWSSDFNVKEPKSGGYFSIHQDSTYTGLEPANLGVTVWLAISDANEGSGCMTFIEGSHKFGQLPHFECRGTAGDDKDNMLSRKQYVEINGHDDAGKGRRVIAALRAGQASLHHFHLLHKSGANNSSQPRIGLALRYIAASVKQTGKVREAVTLISGKVEHIGFDLEPSLPIGRRASALEVERGKSAHRHSMAREKCNYFDSSAMVKEYT
jgi:ectoine hydroxylase-related dioxygenase (phytanoyl-CoA dioxygenase family)